MDRRFAIIIGINNYNKSPLNYCVKDANDIAEILEKRCRFNKDDIFIITSSDTSPISDISGHFDQALSSINGGLKLNEDSIFFYFAGHGHYHFSQSALLFHDTYVEIAIIFER